jgi:hypothetical protein
LPRADTIFVSPDSGFSLRKKIPSPIAGFVGKWRTPFIGFLRVAVEFALVFDFSVCPLDI